MRSVGWLLDVYIDADEAILWIKTVEGASLRLTDRYRPDFYAEPASEARLEELEDALTEHPNIDHVEVVERYGRLEAGEKTRVLHVFVDEAGSLSRVLKDLRRMGLFKAFYNVYLLHVQRYLFWKGLAPTSKVEAEHDGARLRGLRVLDDSREVEPPPFTTFIFSIEPTDKKGGRAVHGVILYNGDLNPIKVIRGDEEEILRRFEGEVSRADPDILVSPCIEADLRRLHFRATLHGLNLRLGREEAVGGASPSPSSICGGRVPLNLGFYGEYGVAGMTERARFTYAPPGLSSKWPAGKTIDSRQCFEALRRGVMIPKHGFYVRPRTALETVKRDRGGFILAPEAGLHENVAELDYESMFPQIIVRENVSYETVGALSRCGLGLLGVVAREPLERRLYFKHLKRRLPAGSLAWLWCDRRQRALKEILVCIYGYSSCFANRFGNVATFEEVNLVARERLVETLNIALRRGFRVIYADTDSVFVKKPDASRRSYEALAHLISAEVGLPIALDHHYRFLVLLTRETDQRLEVAKRYYGKLYDGGLHSRGIELRRRDTPPYIREFQEELMRILFDAENAEEVRERQVPKALEYVRDTCSEILGGGVRWNRLVVSKRLSKGAREYRSSPPHVVAARELALKGVETKPGDLVDYIHVDSGHSNPYRRVVPAVLLSWGWRGYDREKYVDLLLDAAETILGVFRFNRGRLRHSPRPLDLLEVI